MDTWQLTATVIFILCSALLENKPCSQRWDSLWKQPAARKDQRELCCAPSPAQRLTPPPQKLLAVLPSPSPSSSSSFHPSPRLQLPPAARSVPDVSLTPQPLFRVSSRGYGARGAASSGGGSHRARQRRDGSAALAMGSGHSWQPQLLDFPSCWCTAGSRAGMKFESPLTPTAMKALGTESWVRWPLATLSISHSQKCHLLHEGNGWPECLLQE